MGKYFGTDGIRGVAGKELTPELALKIGRAAGTFFKSEDAKPRVVVGRDPRRSGDMLEAALTAGLLSVGVEVIRLGVMTTPGVAFLTKSLGAKAGAVISASHNPVEDNGIKFFGADGFKLSDDTEEKIERYLDDALTIDTLPRLTGKEIGEVTDAFEGVQKYMAYLKSIVPGDLEGLKIVLDCANGAASHIAERLFIDLGAEVESFFCQPDGININVGCGSTQPQALQEKVVALGADVGLAFDGDADRLIAVDETGAIVDGDYILSYLGTRLAAEGALPGRTIVTTVMANLGLIRYLKKHHIDVRMTPVGDRYVVEAMLQGGFTLGGEQSGHIVFLNHGTTGDGLITALMLLTALKADGGKLSEKARVWEKYPQVLLNVRVREKNGWDTVPDIVQVIDEVSRRLGEEGRVLVRPSGTEPIIRVMVEGPEKAIIEQEARQIAQVIEKTLG